MNTGMRMWLHVRLQGPQSLPWHTVYYFVKIEYEEVFHKRNVNISLVWR